MEPEAFAELEGEAQGAIPGDQGCQRRTTVPACLAVAQGAAEGVHASMEH
jgi:hypothetical protein